MRSLEHLDLRYSKIEHVDSVLFSRLFYLKYLVLSANKLQYVHQHTFLGSPNIERLCLENNFALQIPTDRHFINSRSLSELGIVSCHISSLSVETFAKFSALNSLDISDNNLKTLEINILSALKNLSTQYMYNNPLQYDCQLEELWRWCEVRNIRAEYHRLVPKYDTPSKVK